MTTSSNARKYTVRDACLAGVALLALFACVPLTVSGQEAAKPKDEKVARSSIEVSGYTRPGNPDDIFSPDGDLIRRVSFAPQALKKFKIMGGTVYFAVFKNMGTIDGDTFSTGLTNFDARFEAGRSFKDTMSPRYDAKARYLYLYQVVNDRNLDPRLNLVKGAKGGGGIVNPLFDPKAKAQVDVPVTDDIASFALKLLVDPRYITSWGHFRDSSFVANVNDTDVNGKPIKQVVDDGKNKVERDKIIRLAFSHLPAVELSLSHPAFSRRARSYSLGDLEKGFGVDQGSLNVQESKAYGELKQVVGQIDKGNIKLLSFGQGLLKASESAKEPDFVQLMYSTNEERAAPIVPPVGEDLIEDEITRAIFRVDWRNANLLRQGYRSVVFGFTSDQPPMAAPIRIDTPTAAAVSQGMRLASYFAEDAVARSTTDANGIALTAGGADAAALALAVGTSLGVGATPQPGGGGAAAPGFAGITGGFSGLGGGNMGGGGGGGFGVPSLVGSFNRPSGVVGGGGGLGGGTGSGGGNGQGDGTSNQGQNNNPLINFTQTLTNQQQQQQKQNQNQNQNQSNRGNHGGRGGNCGGGHVVPAPASLLLGLLGLPGLWFLRRRKANPETPA
ncbi:MAG: hypothetical protein HYX68_22255 [Planctomycetes bacterium]|nr:hypothetical protein [Planctomycetota bacterium]